MSDDKWAWFNEEDQIAALLKGEPSTSKTDAVGLRLDVMAPDAARTPASSAALGRAVALYLEGKTPAALKELSAAIEGGDNPAELYSAMGHIQFEVQQFEDAAASYGK